MDDSTKEIIYVLIVNLAIIALGGCVFYVTESLWSLVTLLFLQGIRTNVDGEDG